MFGIDFTEFVVIGVVALIVLGPERLPKAAKTAGHLLARVQRYVSNVKSDIKREMDLSELDSIRKEMEGAAKSLQTTVTTNLTDFESSLKEASRSIESAVVPQVTDIKNTVEANLSMDPNMFEDSIAKLNDVDSPVTSTASKVLDANALVDTEPPVTLVAQPRTYNRQPGEEGFLSASEQSLPYVPFDPSLHR